MHKNINFDSSSLISHYEDDINKIQIEFISDNVKKLKDKNRCMKN